MSSVQNRDRFKIALALFDRANSQDPHTEIVDGQAAPRELLYAQRLSAWVTRLCPEASEALQLAAHSQHLCRWMIPRGNYPMDRPGYLRWRTDLKKSHADKAAELLREAGYAEDIIQRVRELNLKARFPDDAEARILEDALCLVFLEFQLADLAAKTAEEKVVNALRKSWKKMTPQGRAEALKLKYAPREELILKRALEAPH